MGVTFIDDRSNRPIETSGYIPDIPDTVPTTRVYVDGQDGISNDWRIRDHWNPTAIWASLTSNQPPVCLCPLY